jgi:hypothetical protein
LAVVCLCAVTLAGCNDKKFERSAGITISAVQTAVAVQSAIVQQLAADKQITPEQATQFVDWSVSTQDACRRAGEILTTGDSVKVKGTKIAAIVADAYSPQVFHMTNNPKLNAAYVGIRLALEGIQLQL